MHNLGYTVFKTAAVVFAVTIINHIKSVWSHGCWSSRDTLSVSDRLFVWVIGSLCE